MTDLQKRFCEEYVIDSHITNAGRRAGIQGDNINVTAWKMLQLPEVQSYVEKLQEEAAERCQITKDQWLNEWKKLGFSDIGDYLDRNGNPKDLSEVDNRAAIKGIKKQTIETPVSVITNTEYILHDKIASLVNIGKHLGWYEKDNSQLRPVLPKTMAVTIVPPTPEDE